MQNIAQWSNSLILKKGSTTSTGPASINNKCCSQSHPRAFHFKLNKVCFMFIKNLADRTSIYRSFTKKHKNK